MKTTLLTVFLFLIFFASAQTKQNAPLKGYGSISGMFTTAYNDGFGASASGGFSIGKIITAGMTLEGIKFTNIDAWYFPISADLRIWPVKNLYIQGQGGYSAFNLDKTVKAGNSSVTTSTSGGLFYGFGAGYFFKGKVAPFISARGANYRFATSIHAINPSYDESSTSDEIGFVLNVGIHF